ncbi:MAG: TetR family transcriptional regulator [Actinomycetota bacterium]|nr:TetR family transcriptional regulator [Actinomycetota bacterium]
MDTTSKAGRRPGSPDSRSEILAAAKASFYTNGYAASTIRDIANSAGVDPALVLHFFGSKAQLLVESLESPALLSYLSSTLSSTPKAKWGETIASLILNSHGSTPTPQQENFIAIIRLAGQEAAAARKLQSFFRETIVKEFRNLGIDFPETRAAALMSILVGNAYVRRIILFQPDEDISVESKIAMFSAILQAILTTTL